jgi:hypothetical protein
MPAIAQSILAIIGSIAAVGAAWYLGGIVLRWRQARAIEQQLADSIAAAKRTEQTNHQTQADLDHLADIERSARGGL